jgi:hypothetical protein
VDEQLSQGVDTDRDGTPDGQDSDSDGDGIPDSVEAGDTDARTPPRDTNGDGTPDFRSLDADGNGIPDADDGQDDLDGDGFADRFDIDDDGDYANDRDEMGSGPPWADHDGDGTPDYQEPDCDGDTILDGHELGADVDHDGILDVFDTDSDGDGLLDSAEAGDADLMTPPVDTDSDGVPNFRDLDSDGDGATDAIEVTHGSSVLDTDSDDDGVDDLVEISYGSSPTDASDSPRSHGDFVFVVPYSAPSEPAIPPTPPRDSLSFSTSLRRVDVYIAIDSSGSMDGEIANLTAGFRDTVVPELVARIPEVQFGVGRFEDCADSSCRNSINNTQDITSSTTAIESALSSMSNLCGGAEPYRDVLWLLATGDTTGYGQYALPRTRRCTDSSTIGWPCFRSDAVRVIIQVGDEPFVENDSCARAKSYSDVTTALNAAQIRYIGIESGNASLRTSMQSMGRDTGSVSSTTGLPFVYTISSSGTGLSSTVVDAVAELAGNIPVRVDANAVDDPTDAVDAPAAFIDHLEANISGGTVLGRVCTNLPTADGNSDGFTDYFPSVLPGTSVCFDIVAKPNQTVPATAEPQIFKASIDVVGDQRTPLDTRSVYFVVPPVIESPLG